MISLEKIRNRSGLLLVVIGVAMFAFIMMDFMSSQRGGGATEMSVGEIHGETIDLQQFEARVQKTLNLQRANNPNVDVEQIRSSVWAQLVQEQVMGKEYEALGLAVGSDELFDMVQGNEPHPSVIQAFTNPETGTFDRARLLQYLKQGLENDATGEAKARWLSFEEGIQKERLTNKYNTLVSKGLFVSDAQAKAHYQAQNEMRDVSYISIPFRTIDDSLVDVSDADIRTYMNNNSERFQQEASRGVEYVVFAVTPSEQDDADALKWIEDIKSDFAKAEDNALFVRRYTDNANASLGYVAADKIEANYASLATAEEGTVVGPFREGYNNYRIAKLVAAESRADSVKARHILLSGANAAAEIDSLKNVIEAGADFAAIAQAVSADQGSAKDGGDLGWFPEGRMVPEFNEACFGNNEGGLQVVTTQFGVHLIDVTKRSAKTKKFKIAYIDRNVVPSNETYQGVFTQAGKFAAENTTADQFNESVISENLSKRIADDLKEDSKTISGLENPRELVRWAYEANIGDVSDVMEFGDKFVVATLASIKAEGLQDVEDARAGVTTVLMNEKKGEMIMAQLEGSDLDALAADFGVVVKAANGVAYANAQVPMVGNEPAFVGATFALEKGQVSAPFVGKSAVYVVRLDHTITAPEGDFQNAKRQIANGLQSRSQYEVFQTLEDKSNVVDNRAKFY